MTFRNRTITSRAAHGIADAMAREQLREKIDASLRVVDDASATLTKAVFDIVIARSPAKGYWDALEDRLKSDCLEYTNSENTQYYSGRVVGWDNNYTVIAKLTDGDGDVIEQHRVDLMGMPFFYADQRFVTRGLKFFIGEHRAQDFQIQGSMTDDEWQALFNDMPEHIVYDAALAAYRSVKQEALSLTCAMRDEMEDRKTKDVIAAWPEIEAKIHKHYSYTSNTTIQQPIPAPFDTFVSNVLTPLITHVVAE